MPASINQIEKTKTNRKPVDRPAKPNHREAAATDVVPPLHRDPPPRGWIHKPRGWIHPPHARVAGPLPLLAPPGLPPPDRPCAPAGQGRRGRGRKEGGCTADGGRGSTPRREGAACAATGLGRRGRGGRERGWREREREEGERSGRHV